MHSHTFCYMSHTCGPSPQMLPAVIPATHLGGTLISPWWHSTQNLHQTWCFLLPNCPKNAPDSWGGAVLTSRKRGGQREAGICPHRVPREAVYRTGCHLPSAEQVLPCLQS